MRWEAESDFHPLVKSIPHLAFVVDDLDFELDSREFSVIVQPNPPSDGIRVAMIELNGLPIELMEFNSKHTL